MRKKKETNTYINIGKRKIHINKTHEYMYGNIYDTQCGTVRPGGFKKCWERARKRKNKRLWDIFVFSKNLAYKTYTNIKWTVWNSLCIAIWISGEKTLLATKRCFFFFWKRKRYGEEEVKRKKKFCRKREIQNHLNRVHLNLNCCTCTV